MKTQDSSQFETTICGALWSLVAGSTIASFGVSVRPSMTETTALGAAMAAGAAEGIDVWNMEEGQATTITTDVFTPSVTQSGLSVSDVHASVSHVMCSGPNTF